MQILEASYSAEALVRFIGLQAVSQLLETFDFLNEFVIAAFVVLLISAIGFDFPKLFFATKQKEHASEPAPAATNPQKGWHGSEHK